MHENRLQIQFSRLSSGSKNTNEQWASICWITANYSRPDFVPSLNTTHEQNTRQQYVDCHRRLYQHDDISFCLHLDELILHFLQLNAPLLVSYKAFGRLVKTGQRAVVFPSSCTAHCHRDLWIIQVIKSTKEFIQFIQQVKSMFHCSSTCTWWHLFYFGLISNTLQSTKCGSICTLQLQM